MSASSHKEWLAVFLASFSSIDNPEFRQIINQKFDLDKNHIALIQTINRSNKREFSSHVFSFNLINPFANGQWKNKWIQTIFEMSKKYPKRPILSYNYNIGMKYSKERQETIYHVTREKIPYKRPRGALKNVKPFPDLLKMPKITANALNFVPENKNKVDLSIMNILIRYFTQESWLLQKLSIKFSAEFLIRSIHAIMVGHFENTLKLSSQTNVHLKGSLKSVSFSAPDFFCFNEPVVLWTGETFDQNEKFIQPKPSFETGFVSDAFISVYFYCSINECMWRRKTVLQNRDFNPFKWFRPIVWKAQDTVALMDQMKHELDHLLANKNLPLGYLMYGWFLAGEFSNLFKHVRLVLLPSKKHDYFSFILVHYDFALVLNVLDNQINANVASKFDSLLFNINCKGLKPNRTQVVNIFRIPETKPKFSTTINAKFETYGSFVNRYQVMIEKESSFKQPITGDDREIDFTHQNLLGQYLLSMNRRSLDDFIILTNYILNRISLTGSENQDNLSAIMNGILSKFFAVYKLNGPELLVFDINKNFHLEFVAIFVQKTSEKSPAKNTEYWNALMQKVDDANDIQIHQLILLIDNVTDIQASTQCNLDEHNIIGPSICYQINSYNHTGFPTPTFDRSTWETCPEAKETFLEFSTRGKLIDDQKEVRSIHNMLVYGMMGSNLQKVVVKKVDKASNLPVMSFVTSQNEEKLLGKILETSLATHTFSDDPNLGNQLENIFAEIRVILNDEPGKNFKIIPADDGLYIGFSEDHSDLEKFIFSIDATIHSVEGVVDTQNLLFVGDGTKSVKTGDKNDVILIDKSSKIDGFIDTKEGNDTLVLFATKSTLHSQTIIKSETGQLVTLKTDGLNELTLLNVEHILGSKNSHNHLELKCGLRSVNLRGGTNEKYDHIQVDVETCPQETSIILEGFTQIHQKSGNDKLRYNFIGGRANMEFEHQTSERFETLALVAVQFKLADLGGIKVLWKNDSHCDVFIRLDPENTQWLYMFNFNSKIKVIFEDDYQLYIQNHQLYMGKDCNEDLNHQKFQISQNFYNELVDQKITVVEKCSTKPTIIYTGTRKNEAHNDIDILPDQYLSLENYPYSETYFMAQKTNLPIVYNIENTCQTLTNCQTVKSTVELNNDALFDMRELTRQHENYGFVSKIMTEPDSNNANKLSTISILVTKANLPDIKLAEVNLEYKINEVPQITVLTSRNRFELPKSVNGPKISTYLSPKRTYSMILIENMSRMNLIDKDSGRKIQESEPKESRHGDFLVYDHATSSDLSVSAIYLKN